MSKHPTSELTPRDIACIEYGRWVEAFEEDFEWLQNPPLWDVDSRYMKRDMLKKMREARERIFRDCQLCAHNGKCHTLGVTVFPAACYCKNYKYEVAGRNNIAPAPARPTRKGWRILINNK